MTDQIDPRLRSRAAGPLLTTLRSRVAGEVIGPEDPDYDRARAVWNGMIDRRPAAILRCADEQDVRAGIDLARQFGHLLAVRGGGHNVSGNAVCDDGVVLDLSPMKAIEVDTTASVPTVRAGGGVTIGELDAVTQQHGLAVPMGLVSETGIAGLTLGGGTGWLRRKYGLSIDNLIAAEVVVADGRLIRCSEEHDPELFWALRGGGGSFGVVTEFTFQAHPIGPDVAFAFLAYAREGVVPALRAFRDWARDTPDDISAFAVLWHLPEMDGIPSEHHHEPGLALLAMHAGPADTGETALEPFRALGSPVADLTSRTPYLEVQQFFDADYPAHVMRYYWKSTYLSELTDEVIERLSTLNEQAPSLHSTLDVWQLGGALGRIDAGATAFGDRSAPYLLGIEANWEDQSADAQNMAWARKVQAVMQPYSTGAQYLNFPGFYEEGEQTLRTTFGSNLERLVAAKATYDPDDLFRLNANIPVRLQPTG